MDISFIIISWNSKSYLLKCLESLASIECGYTSETIVVDNASTDGTPRSVRDLFPEVRLIENLENIGFARGNNLGISIARGRYICLLNADVEVHDGCVMTLLNEIEEHPEIGMIGPQLIEGSGKVQTSCWGFPTVWNIFSCALWLDRIFPKSPLFNGYEMRYSQASEACYVDILGGAFWFARRAAVIEVGPIDEGFFMYGEDMDWCRRFWQAGWRIRFFPNAKATHYGGASSANAPIRFYVEMQRANLQYWKKHHAGIAWFAIYCVYCLHHLIRVTGHYCALLFRGKRREDHEFKMHRSMACLNFLFSAPLRMKQSM